MYIIELQSKEDESVEYHVGDSRAGDYIDTENQVFSDKKLMKKTVALYAIHNSSQYGPTNVSTC